MSGLISGKYLIVLANQSVPVGANNQGGSITPVVSGGGVNVWTARKLGNGNYTLTLDQSTGPRWLSEAVGGCIVVETTPPPAEWKISRQPSGFYTIEVPSGIRPTSGWTLSSNVPGTKVKLGVFELPGPNQLWKFSPVT